MFGLGQILTSLWAGIQELLLGRFLSAIQDFLEGLGGSIG